MVVVAVVAVAGTLVQLRVVLELVVKETLEDQMVHKMHRRFLLAEVAVLVL
jgi:hypothetical protein